MKNLEDDILKQTCYSLYDNNNIECQRKSCRHWVNCERFKNCSILIADSGPKTLQQIGEIFGLTRMRICQIEKKAITKLTESSELE